MKFKFLLSITFFLLSANAYCQYEVVRNIQDRKEQELFRRLGVRGEVVYLVTDTGRIVYKGKAFNLEGKLLGSREYSSRLYLNYNSEGLMDYYLDTSVTEEGVTVMSFQFQYDPKGRVMTVKTHEGTGNLNFMDQGTKAKEVFVRNDGTETERYYYFNDKGQPLMAEFFDQTGKLYFKEKKQYKADGTLDWEYIVQETEDVSYDSTYTYYVYADNMLQSKHAVFKSIQYVSRDGSGIPTHSLEHESKLTTTYFYDKMGRKIGEEFINSKNELASYYYSWTYDDRGLVIKHSEKRGVLEPVFFVHEYEFY